MISVVIVLYSRVPIVFDVKMKINTKKISSILFLLAGIFLLFSGVSSIFAGSVSGWGEDDFVRTSYTAQNSPLLFWAYSIGKAATGLFFVVISALSLRDKD